MKNTLHVSHTYTHPHSQTHTYTYTHDADKPTDAQGHLISIQFFVKAKNSSLHDQNAITNLRLGEFLRPRRVLFLHLFSYAFSVDGKFSSWSSWGACSNQCGDGTQTRSRTCNNPTPAHGGNDCQGNPQESRTCKLKECPGNDYQLTF